MADWFELQDPNSGQVYYANKQTKETRWDMPDEMRIYRKQQEVQLTPPQPTPTQVVQPTHQKQNSSTSSQSYSPAIRPSALSQTLNQSSTSPSPSHTPSSSPAQTTRQGSVQSRVTAFSLQQQQQQPPPHHHHHSSQSSRSTSTNSQPDLPRQTSDPTKTSPAATPKGGYVGMKKPLSVAEIMFEKFDTEKTGVIGPLEFQLLCRNLGYAIAEPELQLAFLSIDFDGSGEVSKDEFSKWWSRKDRWSELEMDENQLNLRRTVSEVYRTYDILSKGIIDQENYDKFYYDLIQQKLTNLDSKTVFAALDPQKEGTIHFREFVEWLAMIGTIQVNAKVVSRAKEVKKVEIKDPRKSMRESMAREAASTPKSAKPALEETKQDDDNKQEAKKSESCCVIL